MQGLYARALRKGFTQGLCARTLRKDFTQGLYGRASRKDFMQEPRYHEAPFPTRRWIYKVKQSRVL
jgi:hypothetical protein